MFAAKGLYGHIRNNNVKSTVLLASFSLYVAMLWFTCCLVWVGLSTKFQPIIMRLAGQHPTFEHVWQLTLARTVDLALSYAVIPVSLVPIWFGVAFVYHKAMIRAGTGARPIVRRLDPELYNLVENLTIAAGMPMPAVEIIESDALNAYASGLGMADASIAVTRGLLQALSKDELEAVLAHEITHIRNRDVRLMVVAIIFVGILAFGAQVLRRAVWDRSRNGRVGQPLGGTDIVLFAVAALLASIASLFGMLSKFAISRSREFVADAGAVQLTKNPDALISALRKISGHEDIPGVPATLHAMMISSRLRGLFSTHPTVEQRIIALETYAGGRREVPLSAQLSRVVDGIVAANGNAVLPGRRGSVAARGALLQQKPFGRRQPHSAPAPSGS